jgi:hypothetical protein
VIEIEDLRKEAFALPEAEEGTHFGLPAWKVGGKVFVHPQPGETHALAFVPQTEAEALADEAPDTFEPVWRSGSIFVGVRIDLARVAPERLSEVIGHAWRHRAPKRLAATHPEAGDGLPVGLSAPATRALERAGYTTLGDLTAVSEREVARLHGVGPAAIRRLRAVLAWNDRSFSEV